MTALAEPVRNAPIHTSHPLLLARGEANRTYTQLSKKQSAVCRIQFSSERVVRATETRLKCFSDAGPVLEESLRMAAGIRGGLVSRFWQGEKRVIDTLHTRFDFAFPI